MGTEQKNVTSIEDLKKYAQGAVVELSPFSESFPFVCRLKRPHILELVENGNITNDLLPVAVKLFTAEEEKTEENKSAEEMLEHSINRNKILIEVAKASLVQPTYEEIKKAGLELTPEQLIDIYNYVNTGVEQLKFFRSNE